MTRIIGTPVTVENQYLKAVNYFNNLKLEESASNSIAIKKEIERHKRYLGTLTVLKKLH